MKTKENIEAKTMTFDKATGPKPRSLRPMRSMVAVRSLKPKTKVAVTASASKMEEIRN